MHVRKYIQYIPGPGFLSTSPASMSNICTTNVHASSNEPHLLIQTLRQPWHGNAYFTEHWQSALLGMTFSKTTETWKAEKINK